MRLLTALALSLSLLACRNNDVDKPEPNTDADGWDDDVDCAPDDPNVHPEADELCNEVDDDCNGLVDDDAVDATAWHVDGDGDGYGDPDETALACEANAGLTDDATDCDDADPDTWPGAPEDCTEHIDRNCDGSVGFTDADGDGWAACEECDDADPERYPGRPEECNNVDDDCDGDTDEDALDATDWYTDGDSDGWGGALAETACDAPEGAVDVDGDCDDTDATVHPSATEHCDDTDDDCDGETDEDAVEATDWYLDADGDGWGDAPAGTACHAPEGAVDVDGDCDDDATTVHPFADEACNSVDDDCDGTVDEDPLWFHWTTWIELTATLSSTTDHTTWPLSPWIGTGSLDGTTGSETITDLSAVADLTVPVTVYDSTGHPRALTYLFERDDTDTWDYMAVVDGAGVDDGAGGTLDAGYALEIGSGTLEFDSVGALTQHLQVPASAAWSFVGAAPFSCDLRLGRDATGMTTGGFVEMSDSASSVTSRVQDGYLALWYADADADGYGTSITTVSCAAPSGYAAATGDCDDAEPLSFPGNPEVCDALDNDCDGEVDGDAADALTWHRDADGDTYGAAADTTDACDPPPGYIADDTDCDDLDADAFPGHPEVCDGVDNDYDGTTDIGASDAPTWYADADGDRYGDPGSTAVECLQPAGYVADDTDCDDSAAAAHPGGTEVCDTLDNDCDGDTDEDDALDASTWYRDGDGDTYGDPATGVRACAAPANHVADATDCDDARDLVNPAAIEICDTLDNDCDGVVDTDASDRATWHRDADGDAYGASTDTVDACTQPAGYVADATDCDDLDDDVFPGNPEVCDGADNDCDGTADVGATDAPTWYADADGDLWGGTATGTACTAPSPTDVLRSGDCDDTSTAALPGGTEICDGLDNDCDGTTDEPSAVGAPTWYADTDTDGYGDAGAPTVACDAPAGHVADATDCDDTATDVNPGAVEVCDDLDNDCDGLADDGLLGYDAACPALDCLELRPYGVPGGAYWLSASSGSYQAFCEMGLAGGGWTLVAKLSNQDARHWANAESGWTGASPYGDTASLSTDADARGAGWGEVIADDFMLTDDANPGQYIATNDSCLGGATASAYFTTALASFPYGGDSYFDTCAVDWTWYPTWSAEPDWGGNDVGGANCSLGDDYLVIARTDSGADTSGVISFYDTTYQEADVGLAALEDGTTYTDTGHSQDVGGPTSCSYNDAQCRSEYPETVYLWVR